MYQNVITWATNNNTTRAKKNENKIEWRTNERENKMYKPLTQPPTRALVVHFSHFLSFLFVIFIRLACNCIWIDLVAQNEIKLIKFYCISIEFLCICRVSFSTFLSSLSLSRGSRSLFWMLTFSFSIPIQLICIR